MATGKTGGRSRYGRRPPDAAAGSPPLSAAGPTLTPKARTAPSYPGEKPTGVGLFGRVSYYGKPDTNTGFDARSHLTPDQQAQAAKLRRENLGAVSDTARSILDAATGYSSLENAIHSGNAAKIAGAVGVQAASVFPFGRAAESLLGISRGVKAARGIDVAAQAVKAVDHTPRTVTFKDATQQLPKARSRVTNVGEHLVDRASEALQNVPHVAELPGLRLMTAGERVAKAAGREQRVERVRAAAAQAAHLDVLRKIKPGSPEDVANFWYAQLPATHRNATGLGLIRAKQAEELQRITSGQALDELNAQEAAVRAKLAEAPDMTAKGPLLRDLEEIRISRTDLPAQADDISTSLAQLDGLIAAPPPVNRAAVDAAHSLANERQQILIESGRLHPERAAARTGLLSRFVGLEPTGEEAYVGHRLARPENSRYPYVPSGGVGLVKSPQGMTANRLVLAKSGRVRQSLHVAAEDWQAAQVFHQANVARTDLAAMGDPFTGHVPAGYSLVNPRGRTVPADWKNEDLAQFQDGYDDIDTIREQAKQILDGFVATDRAGFERMKQQALEQGVHWDELRVVPNRLVERYYSQFRPLRSRGPAGKIYDSAVDAVATSIVFARIGYIPKNLVQNLIMAVPHQGPMLLVNAVRAAQAMADPTLRVLLQAEVGHTGATGALAREGFQHALSSLAGGVSKIADDPVRLSAFMHEAAGAGVISRVHPLLTDADRAALLRLLTDKSQRPLLNDIRQRSVDAMADFSRLTPDQSRMARRFLIIPGWLMAGTRYPFHFAATHPVRSALLAYIALGEPGAPKELHFNHPINEYFAGSSYRQGIEVGGKRLRTGSLNPVSTPYELAAAVAGSARGKTGPFDYSTPQVFDEAQPLLAAGIRLSQGEGLARSLKPLAPNYSLVRSLVSPAPSATFPEDATRLGRLKREVGIVPIKVNDPGSAQKRPTYGGSRSRGSRYGRRSRSGSAYGSRG